MQVKRVLLLGLVGFLMGGCSPDGGDTVGPQTTEATGGARGTIYVDLGTAAGGTASGTVTVAIGGTTVQVPVSGQVPLDGVVAVEYEFTDVDAGLASVLYVADLTVDGQAYVSSGYAPVQIEPGDTVTVDTSSYIDVAVDADYRADGAVQVVDFDLTDPADTVSEVAHVTVSGSLANTDLGVVFVYSDDNVIPVRVDPNTSGTCTFTTVVPLRSGTNTIYLIAANTTGSIVTSTAIHVRYTATGNVMLGTLIWDTPTSDMDLHLWYYAETNPSLPDTAFEHCAFWNKDIDSILPDGDSPNGNLDVDDTEGEGPEHMTLQSYPDGYYVFAINSYDLDNDTHAYCTFTLSVAGVLRTMHHNFTTDNAQSYDPSQSGGWVRCFDVRVSDGVASVLSPDPDFVYHRYAAGAAAKVTEASQVKNPD